MDRSHRRSASTATTSLNDSALTTRRPVTRTDTSDLAKSHGSVKAEDAASDGSDMTSSDDFEMDDIASDDGLEDDEETGLTSTDRQKRRRRKRRGTMLDERVVSGSDTRLEEKRLANRSFWSAFIMNGVFILLWYLFSISITVVSARHQWRICFPKLSLMPYQYNKWMFQSDDAETKVVFPFPLFTTCVHMIVQFSLASLVLYLLPQFRPRHDSVNPHAPTRQPPPEPLDPNKPLMTRMFYLTRIGPCGAATGLDIGLGNMSLKFISMTFYSKRSFSGHYYLTAPTTNSNSSNVQVLGLGVRTCIRIHIPP